MVYLGWGEERVEVPRMGLGVAIGTQGRVRGGWLVIRTYIGWGEGLLLVSHA